MINKDQTMTPSICVIGAGPCGITAAKNLLEQGLLNITVFEKNKQLGGNWVFDEDNEHSSVYETTHIISSKRLSEYEDFPMPKDYPDYPSHSQLLDYFNHYADHFGVRPYIRFGTTVQKVTQTDDSRWQVVYQDEAGLHEALFDYLMVANGHHWDPIMPEYTGQFSGTIMHAHDYKKSAPFKNKRVLVVGGGNSACDIAVETSRVSQRTCISMRNGQHVFPKFIFGKPTDIAFSMIAWMPVFLKRLFAVAVIRLIQGRYQKYHLKKPTGRPLEVHPTINSELLYFIRHGKIQPREGIERIDGHRVYFVDGKSEEFDVIIFATGYQVSFPFFDKAFIDYSTLTQVPLYRKMIHPEWNHLFFIGLFQPQGCIWPLADYQAKIAASLIRGTLNRPPHLLQKIDKEIKRARQLFRQNARHALEVDYQLFRQELLGELKHIKPKRSSS